jgi:integrase
MLLSTLFNDHYRPLKLRGKSPNTFRLYGCTIRAFGKWLKADPTTDELTDVTLSRYLEHRATTRSPWTAEKERTQLLALARFAVERRLTDLPCPCVMSDRPPERTPTSLSHEQVAALFRVGAAARGKVGDVRAAVWWPALFGVLLDTAERISAVLAMDGADFTPPHLLIRAANRKGRTRDRVHELSPETQAAVSVLLPAPGRPIFKWDRHPTHIYYCFNDLMESAGIPRHGPRMGFHALRRTAASWYAKAGGDATRLLDHSSPAITKKWYLDPRVAPAEVPAYKLLPDFRRAGAG